MTERIMRTIIASVLLAGGVALVHAQAGDWGMWAGLIASELAVFMLVFEYVSSWRESWASARSPRGFPVLPVREGPDEQTFTREAHNLNNIIR